MEEKNSIEKESDDTQDNPAPSACIMNLELNLKKLNIDFSKNFFYIKGDITTMAVDVIVNSSAPNMIPQMGVSKSIHNKCGPKLLGVSKSIHNKCGPKLLKYLTSNYNGILEGGIVDSPNFGLKCKKIIHAVGPYQNNDSVRDLEIIYIQCLNYCFSHKYQSIAFPCISTGGSMFIQCLNYCFSHKYQSIAFPCISTGGSMFNEDRACAIAINTCKNWMEKNYKFWKGKIYFCCFTEKSYELYKKNFKELLNID